MAAIFYDCLLLWGVLFLAALPLPLIPESARDVWWVYGLSQAYLLLICLLFFSWFWTHGGQTLGMRAWRLKVITFDGQAIDARAATRRFFAALLSWLALGFGYWWILFDPEKLAWHDRLSETRLIVTPKPAR